MKKTVRIGHGKNGSIYCRIEFTDGKLSITGVEGPTSDGNCRGGAGQIVMHDWSLETLAPGWTKDMVKQFREVWDKWHLNDMRAGCEHQIGPEWEPQDVTIYHFRLKDEINKAQREARKRAESVLKTGEVFTPTSEEVRVSNLQDRITAEVETLPPNLAKDYTPNGPQYSGDNYNKPFEVKKTNWVEQKEHSKGFLCKPCPVCGYKYGTQWRKQEVPQDVIAFLQSLPEADREPAWV